MSTRRSTQTNPNPAQEPRDQVPETPPQAEAQEAEHVAVEPMQHDGAFYGPGDPVPGLSDRQAESLLKRGVIAQGVGKTAAD